MSQASASLKAPDLRNGFPRSPNAMVGPYILLGRILDKCRATIAGTNGEYNYNCPLDRRFFDFVEVDADAFKAEVEKGKSDDEMLDWVQSQAKKRREEEVLTWCYTSRWARPDTPEMQAYFERLRQQVAPNHYNVETWFQLLDAEEGRL